METGDFRCGPFGQQLALAVDVLRGVRGKQCVDCRRTTFKNEPTFDADGNRVHDFEKALAENLIKCSRWRTTGCTNELPKLDRFSAFVLRFFLSKGVQSQWPHGLGVPNGLPRPAVLIEATAQGIEWSEFFADKFAVCEQAFLEAMRELKD